MEHNCFYYKQPTGNPDTKVPGEFMYRCSVCGSDVSVHCPRCGQTFEVNEDGAWCLTPGCGWKDSQITTRSYQVPLR